MLKLNGIRKSYPGFSLDCSLEVLPGRITGLIGANGAGKSTTFKAILGLIRPDGGEIELFGRPGTSLTRQDRRRIGSVLSDSGFSGYLTVNDVIRILGAFYPDFSEDSFRRGCGELSIPLNKQIKDFSTGMKAKLKVLAAINHGARLLILDEPTAGLDVLARQQITDLLRGFMEEDEERSILVSSHISNDLEQLCDDFYMIDCGSIVFHEDTDRLLSDYAFIKTERAALSTLDRSHILRVMDEPYGCRLLTDQRQYYIDNYPRLVVERASMDEFIMIMLKGEKL